jgi:hypothetical protein
VLLIGGLATVGWWLSDANVFLAACGSGATCLWSIGLAQAEARRRLVAIDLGGDGSVMIDGRAVESLEVAWRGALMSLAWGIGGHLERRLAFPDALDPASRRELRLWALSRRERALAPAVAP